ncbi:uncharacterized protein BJ212DRAFT_1341508 [Suillus subaureus]|uniref:Uncharacterized protein n=1 Tax=Suillus subaureus TaxID=48587 RepID=A0A9P7EF22_9AGAM|nr:uncharacterized protein BJ212DRAFT_1341508 [Suillus subaureus]KAG1819539.1 hypothetical protein BJ212DRAFT_1341508 [Suillus subaureus]
MGKSTYGAWMQLLNSTGDDHSADESNAKPNAKLKERAAQLGHVHQTVLNDRSFAKYGKDFWDADTNTAPCRAATPVNLLSSLHWRSLFGSLRFSTRSADTLQSIPLQPRHWNFNLFPVGSSIRTVDRIAIAPPTTAELAAAEAAAAMRPTNGNKAGSSTPPGQPRALPRTQVSQGQPAKTQGAGSEMGEVSYEVRCCGLLFSCGRPTSRQS